MRGRPPKKALSLDQERAALAFVDAAEQPDSGSGRSVAAAASPAAPRGAVLASRRRGTDSASGFPWEAEHVREDVTKGYALRLPEPLYLRLKWVAEQTGRSINAVCREAIEAEVERVLGLQGSDR